MVKKKTYYGLKQVRNFVLSLPDKVQAEYETIIEALETKGFLVEPYGKKLDRDLFEIRIRKGKQIRVFYFYHDGDLIIGVHAFVKKAQKTPKQEIKQARKIISMIKRGEYVE